LNRPINNIKLPYFLHAIIAKSQHAMNQKQKSNKSGKRSNKGSDLENDDDHDDGSTVTGTHYHYTY
jgi:hypothetical protein